MIKRNKLTAVIACITLSAALLAGCGKNETSTSDSNTTSATTAAGTAVSSTGNAATTVEYDDEDFVETWDENSATKITLKESLADVSGNGANASGSKVTITNAGTYVISGKLTDGQIIVNVEEKGTVRLILNNADITSSTSSAIQIDAAKKAIITIAASSTNNISDANRTVAEDEEYTSAIYSKADLIINGSGTLNVNANLAQGIKSKDDLCVISGNININSVTGGMVGKDLMNVYGGNITINAGGDGIKSTYDTDTSKGNVIISGGTINIISGNDGIQAENELYIYDGTITIKTGGGAAASTSTTTTNNNFGNNRYMTGSQSTTTTTDEESYKGLKATNAIVITNGNITVDSKDDSVHSNGSFAISNGTLMLTSGDDGIHAETTLTVDGGEVTVTKSYEGFEAIQITINNGKCSITSSDDGINATSGASTGTMNGGMGGMVRPDMNGTNTTNASTDTNLAVTFTINGGSLYVNAGGDGLDSNGAIVMNGGTTYVDGPSDSGNGALDYDSSFTANGGTLIAVGSSGMAQQATSATNCTSVMIASSSNQSAGTKFSVVDSNNNTIAEFTPAKTYNCVVIVSPDIKTGSSYTFNFGSTAIGTTTISNSISSVGTAAGGMNGGMNGGGMKGGMFGR